LNQFNQQGKTMSQSSNRVDWVDYAKGLTILLVVIMHSTYGVEKYLGAEGWMHHVLAFATPFRMPVFFAVAGLFASAAIVKDWRIFLDRKFAHFFYFYFLWMTIQFIFKAPFFAREMGVEQTALYYISSFVQPFGLLWFIYLLPIYFLFLRLTERAPLLAQFAFAIACKWMLVKTGIGVVDFFSKYYVFFLAGHFGRDIWFRLAETAKEQKLASIAGLVAWALANGAIVYLGYGDITPVAILMGVLGFMAVIDLMAILPRRGLAQLLHFCGQRSLPIYLGFFLPMGIARLTVPKLCPGCSAGMVAFIVSITAILGALAMVEIARRIWPGNPFYNRPTWAHLRARKQIIVPAE
jgi:uncharacterized membrane protein YcfT